MPSWLDVPLSVATSAGHHLGLMALVVLVYSEAVKRVSGQLSRQAVAGLLFGVASIISMVDPVVLAPGLIADIRNVMVGLSGPFGGTVALAICGAMTAAFRIWIGGSGTVPSLVGILTVAAFSLLFLLFMKRPSAELRARHLFLLGAGSCSWLIAVLFLPRDLAIKFLTEAGIPLVMFTTIGVATIGIMLSRELRRIRAEETLKSWALTDALTRLPNRRAFDEELARALDLSKRQSMPTTLAVIDVDRFKWINDSHGHAVGDQALKAIAKILKLCARGSDFAARIGGEEFGVVFRSEDAKGAFAFAERLRETVEGSAIATCRGKLWLTVSIGIAEARPGTDVRRLMLEADQALYEAKHSGRNRVMLFAHVSAQANPTVQSLAADGRASRTAISGPAGGGRSSAGTRRPLAIKSRD